MSKHPKIQMARLREIGWELWDPIGLISDGSDWRTAGFADEYDSYLLRAAGMVRNGEPDGQILDYLIAAEVEQMGLSPGLDLRTRAMSVVDAIRADNQLWIEPD